MRYTANIFTTALLILPGLASAENTAAIDLTPVKSNAVSAADAIDVVREGTRLVSRTGRLNHTADGQQAIFTFDQNTSAGNEPPMIVLPNLNLFLMESILSGRNTDVDFRISGTVTEFKGRNYILLDNVETVLSAAPLPRHTAVPATLPKAIVPALSEVPTMVPVKPTTAALAGISAQQTMNRLLAPPPGAGEQLPTVVSSGPTVDRSTGAAAVAPAAPVLTVTREGTYLTNRTARLNHTPDGQQAFLTFDADGKLMKDPPMVILPNLKLTSMEAAVLSRSSDVHFRVSGTVTEYKGRNYIQLDKAVVIADLELQF